MGVEVDWRGSGVDGRWGGVWLIGDRDVVRLGVGR